MPCLCVRGKYMKSKLFHPDFQQVLGGINHFWGTNFCFCKTSWLRLTLLFGLLNHNNYELFLVGARQLECEKQRRKSRHHLKHDYVDASK